MITIKFSANNIYITGHAEYQKYGKDIICASVSTLIVYTINLLEEFMENENISYKLEPGDFSLEYSNVKEAGKKIINIFINSLNDLASQYPKNIKIS